MEWNRPGWRSRRGRRKGHGRRLPETRHDRRDRRHINGEGGGLRCITMKKNGLS